MVQSWCHNPVVRVQGFPLTGWLGCGLEHRLPANRVLCTKTDHSAHTNVFFSPLLLLFTHTHTPQFTRIRVFLIQVSTIRFTIIHFSLTTSIKIHSWKSNILVFTSKDCLKCSCITVCIESKNILTATDLKMYIPWRCANSILNHSNLKDSALSATYVNLNTTAHSFLPCCRFTHAVEN